MKKGRTGAHPVMARDSCWRQKQKKLQQQKARRNAVKTTSSAPSPPSPPPPAPAIKKKRAPAPPSHPLLLPEHIMPNGSHHCGGDLNFPGLYFADGRTAYFVMPTGAVAIFPAADLDHGTVEHEEEESRDCATRGASGHFSFAVQTPAPVLGVKGDEREKCHTDLLNAGARDAETLWEDAQWLPVHVGANQREGEGKRLHFDPAVMHVLPWQRVVLYDAEKGRGTPVVLYDACGGLGLVDRVRFARELAPLQDYDWHLFRQTGDLAVDERGKQRMVMVGLRDGRRNKHQPPEKRRKTLHVQNRDSWLDAYVCQHDYPSILGPDLLQPMFNALSARMRCNMPAACERLQHALDVARVRERLRTREAQRMCSDDLLVNNVGISSAYQSPAHVDQNDMGWTFAFAVKCPRRGCSMCVPPCGRGCTA